MDDLLYLNKINHKKFHFRVLKEYLFTAQSCWAFPKNSWIVQAFDEKIGLMAENGLTDYLIRQFLDPQYLHIKNLKKGPRKLNIDQLLGGFEVLITGLFLSLLLFCFEFLSKFLKSIHKLFEILM